MRQLFFAYGNLKSGFSQNHLLKSCKLLGVGLTVPEFELYQVSYFPVLAAGNLSVFGELYEVGEKDFLLLDAIHTIGHQKFFERREIHLEEISLQFSPLYCSTWQSIRQSLTWTYVFAKSCVGYNSRGDFWALDSCSVQS